MKKKIYPTTKCSFCGRISITNYHNRACTSCNIGYMLTIKRARKESKYTPRPN